MTMRMWKTIPGSGGIAYPVHASSAMVRYTPIGATTTTSSKAGYFLFGAAVAAGAALLLARRRQAEPDEADTAPRGPGWYVLLYEYDPETEPLDKQKVKGFSGPFDSREEANDEAEEERDIWHTVVMQLDNDPHTLGPKKVKRLVERRGNRRHR